ncbi:interleukin-1 beta [Oncorhynchus tshawytscha]|uniref:Interleukin-1 n=2 Tax=Oncorhynchus tshawytscha TaxID=74940 RepID=A0A8C8HJE4_ONCTS|nr:interleukin-1 beta [Oncorhynchus tshawytscha]XP_024252818.1 interleukin-1 beta [Oncorhynchus tshawytscha]
MDFDLADALRSSCSSMEFDTEYRLPDAKSGPEMERCGLQAGLSLDLEVILQHQGGMRRVAHLVIALHRMKNPSQKSDSTHTPLDMECTDEQFCSIIMDNLVEECVMVSIQEPMGVVTKKVKGTFEQIGSPQQYSLCDHHQKSLVYCHRTMELKAVTIQGGNNRRARFNLSKYSNASTTTTNQALPVVLGIDQWNLSCSKQTDSTTPVLQLERCEDQLTTIGAQEKTVRFLFYKNTTGFSLTTFESAMYPGWFISTSLEPSQPIQMCQKQDDRKLINFMVKH